MCVCVCVNKMGNKIGYTWMESTFRNPHLPIRVCSSKLTDDTVFDSFLLSVERNQLSRSSNDENQDHCSTREKILCLDWWFHLGFFVHLPTDVDQQTGV